MQTPAWSGGWNVWRVGANGGAVGESNKLTTSGSGGGPTPAWSGGSDGHGSGGRRAGLQTAALSGGCGVQTAALSGGCGAKLDVETGVVEMGYRQRRYPVAAGR